MSAPIPHSTPSPEPATVAPPAPTGPSHLRLTGLTEDGTALRLVDEEGREHRLGLDDRLRAAVRPTPTTTSRDGRGMEKTMESTLRPRDIQARIRAGETPEAVAEAAHTSVDRIMPFAAPVLAEREHLAQRAQRSSVRRADHAPAPGGPRTLGDAVATTLRARNVDPETVVWDAWRREDGRWTLTGAYETGERTGTAHLTFDPPGNYVTLDDDDARWLVGETIATPAAVEARDDLQQARQRRLSSIHDAPVEPDQLPLGDDALDLVAEQPLEAFLDTAEPTDARVAEQEAALREEAADAAAEEAEPQLELDTPSERTPEPEETPTRRPVKKTRGRASVPSWDEIMFGGGDRS